ncbi:glycosyltransferase family 2 protein [soil metagenome]
MKKLSSLTIFFPFLNDEGTVERQIQIAYSHGRQCAEDIEVIAIHGGASKDKTKQKLSEMQCRFPELIIIDKESNTEGYAVIKYGFEKATKEWIFYTDGDAQYHLEEDLSNLIETQQKTNADIVNGYKKIRQDDPIRIVLGKWYSRISRRLFNLPIRDTDCDFRLLRKSCCNKISLHSTDSSILPELIVKLNQVKAKFAEVAVLHYPREYGKSNYTPFGLLKEKIIGDIKLFFKLRTSRWNLPIKKIKNRE